MANANVNKVIYGGQTLIDLTSDTVTAADLVSGKTAHDKSGALLTGTAETVNSAYAIVQVTSDSPLLYNKGVVVKNSSDVTVFTGNLDASGSLRLTLPSADTYTFTVTF